MAQTADEFFGELAQGRSTPPTKVKSAEDFFGDLASGKEAPATPTVDPEKERRRKQQELYEAHRRGDTGVESFGRAGLDILSAVPELAASAVTGIEGGIEGLARGAAALVQGQGSDAASDVVRGTMADRTYVPRGGGAQLLGRGLSELQRGVFEPIAAPAEEAMGPQAAKALGSFGEAALAAAPAAGFLRAVPRVARTAIAEASPSTPLRAIEGGRIPEEVAQSRPIEPQPAEISRSEPGRMPERPSETLEMPEDPTKAPGKALTAESAARKAPYTELEGDRPPQFVEETPTAEGGKQLDHPQQLQRAEILEQIGIAEPRTSAVTGDSKAAATDFQTSKLDTPGGDYLKKTFDSERAALDNYADQIVAKTGGTPGLGQTEVLQRGQNIITPLDDLKLYFDDGIKSLYKVAGERARGVPATLLETQKLIKNNKSFFTGTTEGQALYRGVRGRMKELELTSGEGRLQAATVEQAEQLKQYLNEQWKPGNSRLIRKLKDAIDDDVTKAAGEDIYASARGLRALRGRILDDPKGIAKIMDAEGPEGINRSVPVEKIADTITTMPVAQFQHIVKTLKGVPEELQPQSSAALAEIKAQYANKVYEVGSRQATQWNAKGVSQYLNSNAARMNSIFTPEEMKQFATLNDAGHILRFPASYPGAAVQAHNIARSGIAEGIEGGLTSGGAALGGIFGPAGSAVGAYVGKKVGGNITTRMEANKSLRQAQQRTTKISELLKTGKEKK